MTSVRLFISLSCFQEGNKMRLLLGLRGYGSLLRFAQIWVKEKNYVILFYNLKANHCQLSMSKYKGSFLRKYPGVIIQRNVLCHAEEPGGNCPSGAEHHSPLQSWEKWEKAPWCGQDSAAGPALCPGYALAPPDSPCAQQDVLPPSLGSSPHLSEKATSSCSPGTSPWGNVCSGLAVCSFACVWPWLEAGWSVPG